MSELAQKADSYAARIELLAASPEADAMAQIAQEARLLRALLAKSIPAQNGRKIKGVSRG